MSKRPVTTTDRSPNDDLNCQPTKKSHMATKIFIVEDHNEVLPHIYRLIGSKSLPMTDLTLVHFDSHPDLLIPKQFEAGDIFNKTALFDALSIENWILPAVFAGHIRVIFWLKPPWAKQLECGSYHFVVGKAKDTNKIRVSCKENYFVGELLYCPLDNLEDAKDCHLHVIELGTCTCEEHGAAIGRDTSQSALSHNEDKHIAIGKRDTPTSSPSATNDETLRSRSDTTRELLGSSHPYILDVDLDFFSTRDPFKEVYTETQYKLIKKLYRFEKPEDGSDKALIICMQRRREQLEELQRVFTSLSDGRPDHSRLSDSEKRATLESLVSDLSQGAGGPVDYGWLHEVGSGVDDTDLPHHVSSQSEVTSLVAAMATLLRDLPPPSAVTIARSSDDDYCPKHQVDQIQTHVLELLHNLLGEVSVIRDYEEGSSDK